MQNNTCKTVLTILDSLTGNSNDIFTMKIQELVFILVMDLPKVNTLLQVVVQCMQLIATSSLCVHPAVFPNPP